VSPGEAPALELRNISKSFGPARVLHHVDFAVAPGEVHGLLGENGCGKSTLVKIITGVHPPDPGGTMRAWDTDVPLPVTDPHQHGVAVIHQDLGLANDMTVADNIGVASGYGTGLLSPIRRRAELRRCQEVIDELGLELSVDTVVSELKPAERAGVAIARARRLLAERGSRQLFILDEPTAYLSAVEAQRVIDLMRSVARLGSSVVFISHRLPEVFEVTDRVTVMRDGRIVTTSTTADATPETLITAMLGRRLESFFPDKPEVEPGEVVLDVRDLHGERLQGVSLQARAGEVIGFAGLTGMGHEELPYLIGGVVDARAGSIEVDGEQTRGLGPRELIARGVALVPGNRQRDGGWLLGTAQENITLPLLGRYYRGGRLRLGAERRESVTLMERLDVRPPVPERSFASFSGGNQQKIVLAKWLSTEPRILLLDEPTQGVDAGAKHDILELVVQAAAKGMTVLMASGDYEQLANVCDRVLVLRDGRVAASLTGEDISEERIAAHAQAG
jgi:ribose transport system ATP-binding protein